ncbi:MAG TPA: MBL fold metallo-hydrolase [Flavisolibacter sp.]|nr:MBL fold metallo-hydrolase [Flavisolibacter sp.]
MKIAFHGAAKTVTGSKHLITLNDGTNILMDCGMFQGLGRDTDKLNESFGFDPKSISFLLLSHAHIDHTGLIPKLVKEGFAGKIYCTPATKDLTEILLYDSAEIQTYEVEYNNKRRAKQDLPLYEPLYTSEDVKETMQLFETLEYEEWFQLQENVSIYYTNTGHLVGSAAITLKVKEDGKDKIITFSGDVGRYRSILLQPPAPFPQADYIILESTYGTTRHDISFNLVKTLRQWVEHTCLEKKGKLIIPAFSVGRTQEILYGLNQLSLEKRLPEIPYFIDSPLSLKATETIKKYADSFSERLQQVLKIDDDPFDFPGLKYVESVEDSQRLVDYNEPCVILSASGTADAGRVRHHINSCIGDNKNSVLIVGYCGEQSLGGQLLKGVEEVEIFGDPCAVKAEVGRMAGMSAHGDCDELTQFLTCQEAKKVKQIFLVHGEHSVQKEFSTRLELKGFKHVEVPELHQTYIL